MPRLLFPAESTASAPTINVPLIGGALSSSSCRHSIALPQLTSPPTRAVWFWVKTPHVISATPSGSLTMKITLKSSPVSCVFPSGSSTMISGFELGGGGGRLDGRALGRRLGGGRGHRCGGRGFRHGRGVGAVGVVVGCGGRNRGRQLLDHAAQPGFSWHGAARKRSRSCRPARCLRLFRSNRDYGYLVFAGIVAASMAANWG